MEKASVCDQSLTENRLSLLSVWETRELQPGRDADGMTWAAVCVCKEGEACEGRSWEGGERKDRCEECGMKKGCGGWLNRSGGFEEGEHLIYLLLGLGREGSDGGWIN